MQSWKLDRIMLATGDGDFVQVVRALQNKGCRVEVVAFDNVSRDLRREADMFISGYLVPGLLPFDHQKNINNWGKLGSKVRGVCCNHREGYGFMRFMKEINPYIWKTDPREPDSPYETVFFHDTIFPRQDLLAKMPSRRHIFEFDLAKADRREHNMQATNIQLVT